MQPSLLELQRAFSRGVFSGEDDEILRCVITPCEQASERGAIYRNNHCANLLQALRSDYPVIEKLVGDDFFTQTAYAYINATPSRSGDIGEYGHDFAEFLGDLPQASALPYLADVARLERAWLDVFLAAETELCDFSGLSDVTPERLGELRFGFRAAVRLIESPYPALSIWQANQAGADGIVADLDSGAERILVRRVADEVEMLRLPPAEFAWLVSLASGTRLSEAVEAAYAADESFDLSSAFARHLQHTLVSYTEGDQDEE